MSNRESEITNSGDITTILENIQKLTNTVENESIFIELKTKIIYSVS